MRARERVGGRGGRVELWGRGWTNRDEEAAHAGGEGTCHHDPASLSEGPSRTHHNRLREGDVQRPIRLNSGEVQWPTSLHEGQAQRPTSV